MVTNLWVVLCMSGLAKEKASRSLSLEFLNRINVLDIYRGFLLYLCVLCTQVEKQKSISVEAGPILIDMVAMKITSSC